MSERVVKLRLEAAGIVQSEALLAQMEDALSEGYGLALAGDAWLMRFEERLHEIIDDASSPVRGGALRTVASEHARFERDLIGLRRELARLRGERDRVHARTFARSA